MYKREEQYHKCTICNVNVIDEDMCKICRTGLKAVLMKMNDTQRQAVQMRVYYDRSFNYIGKKLGITKQSAREAFLTAIEKIAKLKEQA